MVVQLPSEDDVAASPPDVEAGVIDDARARHRRERWAGAIVTLIAVGIGLLFGLGGGGGGSAPAGHHHGHAPTRATGQSSRPLAAVKRLRHITELGLTGPDGGQGA